MKVYSLRHKPTGVFTVERATLAGLKKHIKFQIRHKHIHEDRWEDWEVLEFVLHLKSKVDLTTFTESDK